MAEAHQPLAAVERVADPRLGVLGRADLAQLVDDLGRCAAVEWTLHRAERTGHRRRDVRAGRRDDPRRERRRVEAVVGPDDEVGIERARRALVGGHPVQLVEEALGRGRGSGPGRPARGRRAGGRTRPALTGRTRSARGRRRWSAARPAAWWRPRPRPRFEARPSAWWWSAGVAARPSRGPGRGRRQVMRGVPFAGPEEVRRWPDTCRERPGPRSGSPGRAAAHAPHRPSSGSSPRR